MMDQEFALTQFVAQTEMAAEQELPTHIGRYQIIAALGSGNMGTVYHALDTLIGRAVALKVIDQERLGAHDVNFDESFRAEVQAIGRLDHPNIVTIYDAELGSGKAYFAMEYIKGQTLKELLDAGIKLPIDRVRETEEGRSSWNQIKDLAMAVRARLAARTGGNE
jgi:serine/threonine protein kinase